ncbi:hypothetical protein [Streptomyces luteolus]|uniref:Mycothiol-dependent maleylpyruvate isomerase metal-binding domain-containing protein n=1 Tax=Streptomyces luteolus TaxID=3043615 RepID=A0ABT6SQX3_9ACTN|nr:hypothetical protein [Streptomyces sp. B-S-A12]MDI3418004.1 hypothetical protein [Streptomyces sp. B-S-A12]
MNEQPEVTETLRHRATAVRAFNQAQAHYEISVLDHIAARIRAAFPTATHLTFAHYARAQQADLRALWQPGADETQARIPAEVAQAALDLDEITDDLTDALSGLTSAAWSAVRPEPDADGLWVLDLPPADRASKIAELVRTHHPDAALLTVDYSADPCRVRAVTKAEIWEVARTVDGPMVADDQHPLWPPETERQISALATQMQALPHLSAQHLLPMGGPEDRTALLFLPAVDRKGSLS